MKKSLHLFVLLALSQIYAISQPCLPEGITFTSQEQIDNFQINYPGCTEIEGDVLIISLDSITNLNGLSVLTSIGGNLEIGNNFVLSSLNGLNNLTSIGGDLFIGDNNVLTSLTGLNGLTYIGGNLEIFHNSLTNLYGLNNLTNIGNSFIIQHNVGLINLTGLENLLNIGGDLDIYFAYTLTSLTGLENLTSIGGGLSIVHSDLANMNGLNNLATIGDYLHLEDNWAIDNLTGLESLATIGGHLKIGGIYGGNALTSLTGLNNLASIGGCLEIGYHALYPIGNPYLKSLAGLNNLSYIGDYLSIIYNDSLSTCEVDWLCQYLSNPNGTITIHDNAPGCNSPEEVLEACFTQVETVKTNIGFTIIPNPSKDKITISSPAITGNTQLSIFNINGEKVLEHQLTNTETRIDISALPRGVYFVRVQNEKKVAVEKIIKQ